MLLSTALITTRDGLVGSERVLPAVPSASPPLPAGRRLLRLTSDHRASVMAAEILEDLRFEAQGGDVASSAVLWRRRAGKAHNADHVALLTLVRPPDSHFAEGLAYVAGYAELRGERLAEIEVQKSDLISFFASILPLCPDRSQRSIEFLGFAMEIAGALAQRFKLAFACPRPYFFSPLLQPMIPTPEHGSWPSGHATQAFTLATVLAALTGDGGPAKVAADSQIFRLAARIAANRTVAGVHFPTDSAAGAMMGITIGNYLVARAGATKAPRPKVMPLRFDGPALDPAMDFHFGTVHRLLEDAADPGSACSFGPAAAVRPAPMLGALWQAAREEVAAQWS